MTVERWGGHEREIVEHPGAVAIVAVDRERFATLVRQVREATRSEVLELAGGHASSPVSLPWTRLAASLRRRPGSTGGEWREAAVFWTTPGFCRERMTLFFAERLERGDPQPEEAVARARPLAGRRDRGAARRDRGRKDPRRAPLVPSRHVRVGLPAGTSVERCRSR